MLLTFVAEFPNVRFFFGIPAWVLGVVYVASEILQLTGDRAGRQLLFYLISLVVGALAARGVGLLDAYPVDPQDLDATSHGASRKRSRRPGRGRRAVGRLCDLASRPTRASSTTCSTRSAHRAWTR